MSVFRRSFKGSKLSCPSSIVVNDVSNIVDDDGVQRYVSVSKLASDISIPRPSEYKLETLLAAGVPLQRVSSFVVGSEPTNEQIVSAVDSVVNSDSNNN